MAKEALRHATTADLDEIIQLLIGVFGTGGRWTPAAFENFYRGDSQYEPEHSVVMECEGRIASHVRFSPRVVRVGEALVNMGAVSSVATLPDCRGRGYASELMRRAHECMARRGDELSMLFTGIQPFYEPLGYVAYPEYSVQKRLSAVGWKLHRFLSSRRTAAGVTIRPLDRARDVEGCMRLHAEGNAALSLSVLRPRQWWRDDYAWSWDTSVDRFLVAERGDHIVGYLRAMRHAGELAVMDAAPFAGEECHHAALLRHVLETAEGVKTVSGPVPSGSPLDEALRALPGETRIWESEGMMLRLIDAGGLLRKVLPRGSAQWSGIPSGAWRGRLTVNLAAGPVCLDICDSTSVDTEAIARREIELCDRDFLLLVLGCTEIDRLAFARDGRLPDDLRATLGHLFPKRPQVFWAMDHF